jgi:transcriptional regulator with XRE-family HTH domain
MAKRDPETDPKVKLGKMLGRERIRAGFTTQDAFAAKLGYDRSTVTKAESGNRAPSAEVLAAWCAACGLDPEYWEEWAALARATDGPIAPWFEDWLHAEREAHLLRIWSPLLIPGLLQTPEYARAVLGVAYEDEQEISDQVALRIGRQAILERPNPPQVTVVLYEYVLHHLIGSPAIMADQLEHVATMTERLHMSIHVLPTTGANVGLSGAFDLASTDGKPDTLRQEGIEDMTSGNWDLVHKAVQNFDLVRRDALPRIPSQTMFLEAAEKWKTR